jgi:RNA polymerase sigma-70 factor, ECF subfamily
MTTHDTRSGELPILSDEEVVQRVRDGETALFEVLMRRHNQRLFRAARAIVKNDAEAEDVMQETYLRAFAHLHEFSGRGSFSTWLTTIAVNEACARLRRGRRFERVDPEDDRARAVAGHGRLENRNPEQGAALRELAALLEREIDSLPDSFRAVFMLRAVSEMSVSETAQCLDIPEDTVKTRLFRARAMLKERVSAETEAALREVHVFLSTRCDRVVRAVLDRIGATGRKDGDGR